MFVVSVAPSSVGRAGEIAAKLDIQLAAAGRQVLTTIRSVAPVVEPPTGPMPDGVDDPRAITTSAITHDLYRCLISPLHDGTLELVGATLFDRTVTGVAVAGPGTPSTMVHRGFFGADVPI